MDNGIVFKLRSGRCTGTSPLQSVDTGFDWLHKSLAGEWAECRSIFAGPLAKTQCAFDHRGDGPLFTQLCIRIKPKDQHQPSYNRGLFYRVCALFCRSDGHAHGIAVKSEPAYYGDDSSSIHIRPCFLAFAYSFLEILFLSGNKAMSIRAIDTLGNVDVPGVF